VVDGYDPEHICLALDPPAALERPRQVQLCLTEAHVRCERLVAMQGRPGPARGTAGVPPDLAFTSTRLVMEPEAAWRNLGGSSRERNRRLLILGGLGAAAALGVGVASAGGMLGSGPGSTGSASPGPTSSVGASVGPSLAPTPTEGAVSAPPASSSAPTPGESTVASPQTYVVQSGDTLSVIAARFGTTVDAIRAANGLTTDIINIGQVLIIP